MDPLPHHPSARTSPIPNPTPLLSGLGSIIPIIPLSVPDSNTDPRADGNIKEADVRRRRRILFMERIDWEEMERVLWKDVGEDDLEEDVERLKGGGRRESGDRVSGMVIVVNVEKEVWYLCVLVFGRRFRRFVCKAGILRSVEEM